LSSSRFFRAPLPIRENDYQRIGDENANGINEWLGEEYANLPHVN
jgi:hypothetical protein